MWEEFRGSHGGVEEAFGAGTRRVGQGVKDGHWDHVRGVAMLMSDGHEPDSGAVLPTISARLTLKGNAAAAGRTAGRPPSNRVLAVSVRRWLTPRGRSPSDTVAMRICRHADRGFRLGPRGRRVSCQSPAAGNMTRRQPSRRNDSPPDVSSRTPITSPTAGREQVASTGNHDAIRVTPAPAPYFVPPRCIRTDQL